MHQKLEYDFATDNKFQFLPSPTVYLGVTMTTGVTAY